MSTATISKTVVLIFAIAALLFSANAAQAYNQYSANSDATNCAACHGDFRSAGYVSNSDGQFWGNLHNIHRSDMLSGDCDTCHSAGGRFPVLMNQSTGGDGLAPLGCVGCHGRAEDNSAANPEFINGYGAGLRQHHQLAGVTECLGCHQDADPANFTVAGENVLPQYYANPGNNHPSMPTGSCNVDGSENFAGLAEGLDNDGNLSYDENDGACNATSADPPPSARVVLLQNLPNPFNPETVIPYRLAGSGWVNLRIYDTSGALVRTLVDAFHDQAATYQARWNGQDQQGHGVPSGVYYYRLQFNGTSLVGKMALVK